MVDGSADPPPDAEPIVAPRRTLSVRTSPLGELFNSPTAWAVIVQRLPGLKLVTNVEKSATYNIMIPDLSPRLVPKNPELLDQIDAELARLPPHPHEAG